MDQPESKHSFDAMTTSLVDFAQRASYEALPADVVHACKLRLIDCFASALGAFDHPVSVMARNVAARTRTDDPATLWGSDVRTSPEAAAFANGVMTRLLDISDTYLGKSRGHPSDMISGLIAAAESAHADGKSLINAVVLAYDVYCSFCQHIDINVKGWDQPVYGVLGCVTGVGKLLNLPREKMAHAIALGLAPNMALAQSRRGHLSNWKGCAGANASRNAVFAAMLAQEGFSGPSAVFDGEGGLWEVIGRHEWPLPDSHLITQTHIKGLPVCYHGQSAVYAALELRDRVNVNEIDRIAVHAYKTAVSMMGADPSRWAPETHETADHSMPYVVATALMDGEVTEQSFAAERLRDPAKRNLMAKVTVAEDTRLSGLYPEGAPGRVAVTLKSGQTHEVEVIYPKGHAKRPMSDDEVVKKFHAMTAARLKPAQRDTLLDRLWHIDEIQDTAKLLQGVL